MVRSTDVTFSKSGKDTIDEPMIELHVSNTKDAMIFSLVQVCQ